MANLYDVAIVMENKALLVFEDGLRQLMEKEAMADIEDTGELVYISFKNIRWDSYLPGFEKLGDAMRELDKMVAHGDALEGYGYVMLLVGEEFGELSRYHNTERLPLYMKHEFVFNE